MHESGAAVAAWLRSCDGVSTKRVGHFAARVTAVFRNEDDRWRLVHAHFSVAVPDDEVVELQQRWSQR